MRHFVKHFGCLSLSVKQWWAPAKCCREGMLSSFKCPCRVLSRTHAEWCQRIMPSTARYAQQSFYLTLGEDKNVLYHIFEGSMEDLHRHFFWLPVGLDHLGPFMDFPLTIGTKLCDWLVIHDDKFWFMWCKCGFHTNSWIDSTFVINLGILLLLI